ncbi:hypothetical protein [Heyndrickxia coagulans]|uniref:hypothetical protein n=1 Tax=Heyndrickxia coagulans TaxID=1398 RepID=UPI001C52DC2A|nr:hypothetical protein [Heyndrickxia coagulans]
MHARTLWGTSTGQAFAGTEKKATEPSGALMGKGGEMHIGKVAGRTLGAGENALAGVSA